MYTGFMSLVCGVIQAADPGLCWLRGDDPPSPPGLPASVRTASKNSRGTAVVNLGHT